MRLAYDEMTCTNETTTISPSLQNREKEGYAALGSGLNCVRLSQSAGITPWQYYQAGTALSDIYCDDYFRRIALHKQKRQFGRSATNDVGTAASAAMGLANAGSAITGGVGTAFGLLDSLFRNYDAAFVVEPNLGRMMDLVKTAQAAHRERWEEAAVTDFYVAHRAINGYAVHCSYVGMQKLLDRAIEEGTEAASIEDTVTRFQNAAERMELQLAEERARIAEERANALQREQDARQRAEELQADVPADEDGRDDGV